MDHLHEMMPEDEILLCGAVLLLGLVLGAVTRAAIALVRERRSA
jgi:hypothetical protein